MNISIKKGNDCSLDQWDEILNIMNKTPEINLSNESFLMEDVSWYITNKDAVFFVAIVEKKVVGYVYMTKEGNCGCLFYIGVDKQFQKLGIGKLLLQRAINETKKWKIKSVYTLSTNEYMTNWIKKSGFEQGRHVAYLELKVITG